MAQDWDIKPRRDLCTGCEAAFVADQVCNTVLTWGEEGYQRLDLCEACSNGAGRSEGVISMWQGVYVPPEIVRKKAFSIEDIEQVMRDQMEQPGEPRVEVVYLLSVMLERKRILVERGLQKRDDGTTVRIYEHRKTGESFLIRDPELKLDELDAARDEVMQLLALPEEPEQEQPAASEQVKAPREPSAAVAKLMKKGGFATDDAEEETAGEVSHEA